MKRPRSDSKTAAVNAAQAVAAGPLQPPAHIRLRDGDWPFWEAITRARARDTWNDVDLTKAANLARCQADIERISTELLDEADIVLNARGTPVVNPKHALLETLSRREIALSRVIHVHAEATVGKSEDAGKALETERKARQSAETDDDGLIARPGPPKLHAVK